MTTVARLAAETAALFARIVFRYGVGCLFRCCAVVPRLVRWFLGVRGGIRCVAVRRVGLLVLGGIRLASNSAENLELGGNAIIFEACPVVGRFGMVEFGLGD